MENFWPTLLVVAVALSTSLHGCIHPPINNQNPSRICQKAKEERCDLTIVGGVLINDGIGKQAIDLIETLKDSFCISFIHTTPPNEGEIQSLPSEVQNVLQIPGNTYKGRVLIFEDPLSADRSNGRWEGHFWQKYGLKESDKKQIRIAYSMFESSKIPESWVDILNGSFDAVAVPDPFLVRVYQGSGVQIPIFVVPLGRDLHRFLSAPLKSSKRSPFVFGTFNLCDRRKNTLKLVQAFAKAFGNNPNVELRLYWRTCLDSGYRERIFSEIANQHLTNVHIYEGPVDGACQFSRFQRIDCLVSIATGEGFSIQPREAMALGIPVIATDNTAQSTICASGLVRTVPSNIEIPAMYPWSGDYGFQYDCRIKDVTDALTDVYEHYNEYLNKAPQCREWARAYDVSMTQFTYANLVNPRRVVVGTSNTLLADGITTTSSRLAKKYRSIFKSLKTKPSRHKSR
jgi:glycosyltransferase involved in cell wall biosynthesis